MVVHDGVELHELVVPKKLSESSADNDVTHLFRVVGADEGVTGMKARRCENAPSHRFGQVEDFAIDIEAVILETLE